MQVLLLYITFNYVRMSTCFSCYEALGHGASCASRLTIHDRRVSFSWHKQIRGRLLPVSSSLLFPQLSTLNTPNITHQDDNHGNSRQRRPTAPRHFLPPPLIALPPLPLHHSTPLHGRQSAPRRRIHLLTTIHNNRPHPPLQHLQRQPIPLQKIRLATPQNIRPRNRRPKRPRRQTSRRGRKQTTSPSPRTSSRQGHPIGQQRHGSDPKGSGA